MARASKTFRDYGARKSKRRGSISRPLTPDHKGRQIRVCIFDDYEMVTSALATIIKGAPERDLVFAGSHVGFDDGITQFVAESKADVVIADVVLGAPDKPENYAYGIPCIRRLRRTFGPSLGIIAYSVYPATKTPALNAGADLWLPKGATNDNLRQAIRNCKNHDVISRIELFLDSHGHEIVLTISRASREVRCQKFCLNRDAFALLCYLAEERTSVETGWLLKREGDDKAAPYEFKETSLWLKICNRYSNKSTWDNLDIARQVTFINQRVSQYLQYDEDVKLIAVPGQGRRAPGTAQLIPSMYSLNEFIASGGVFFRGARC